MTDQPIDLDRRRGMLAQRDTEVRRLLAEVHADEVALQRRQQELEDQLAAEPAESWRSAADKARYLLMLFSATSAAQDPRRRKLIANVLADFERLSERDALVEAGDRTPADAAHAGSPPVASAAAPPIVAVPRAPGDEPSAPLAGSGKIVPLAPGGPKKPR